MKPRAGRLSGTEDSTSQGHVTARKLANVSPEGGTSRRSTQESSALMVAHVELVNISRALFPEAALRGDDS